jgi:hypothetical protein
MRLDRVLCIPAVAATLGAAPAFAASASGNTDNSSTAGKHDTAKGAAAGALAGHERGSGHALAGAGVGAAIGHHEKKKAQRESKQ